MAATFPIAYLNGAFVPTAEARISPLDRGFLFGDSVYEVIPVHNGQMLLLDAHIRRLRRNLLELGIANPHSPSQWVELITELLERNSADNVAVYIQVTRGADTGRDHVYSPGLKPTVFAMMSALARKDYAAGVKAITLDDIRWQRCDIKATALLANVLARKAAFDVGAIDAILVRDGYITEGAVSSVLLVENGDLIRRPHGKAVLPGTTTDFVVEVARNAGRHCREELISLARLRAADEIWLTGATKDIAPVVELDNEMVGDGAPGPVWQDISARYRVEISGRAN